MTTNVKPCPFCGQEPEQNAFGYYHLGSEVREIRCVNADCRVKPLITRCQAEESEFSLLEEWNTRAMPAKPALDPATDGTRRALSLCLNWLERDDNRPADEEIAQEARALASGETK